MTLIQCCMVVQKQLNLNLELNQKSKKKSDKNKKSKWKINIEKELETIRAEMSILSETERNKDLKTRKASKVIRSITSRMPLIFQV